MKILITSICDLAGSAIARALLSERPGLELTDLDKLSREGGHHNLAPLRAAGVRVLHDNPRRPSDLDALPAMDVVIGCDAAEKSLEWRSHTPPISILEEIATRSLTHPNWPR